MARYCESVRENPKNLPLAMFLVDYHGCYRQYLCMDCWVGVFTTAALMIENKRLYCHKCERYFPDIVGYFSEMSMTG